MENSNYLVVSFLSIAGIVAGLPLVLLEKRITPGKLFLGGLLMELVAALASFIVSLNGKCTFSESYLMTKDLCNNFPFVKYSSVATLHTLTMVLMVLTFAAACKKLLFQIKR